jgi:molybdopterin synthase sulfur carrier subunit
VISVVLPAHLRQLAGVGGPVQLPIQGPATRGQVLDALEASYPMLRGTIRDPASGRRRAFIRYFACQQDLSHDPDDVPLPPEVCSGAEPLLVIGALAGG